MRLTAQILGGIFAYPQRIFNAMRGLPDRGYAIKGGAVYRDGSRIAGADGTTFKVLGRENEAYAHDARNVYYHGRLVKGADSATFAPLTQGDEQARSVYWKDARQVYLQGKVLAHADAASFALYPASPYAHDHSRVFYQDAAVAGAHPDTFKVFKESFARDDQRVYYLGQAVFPGIDPQHFELLPGGGFARDQHQLYQVSVFHGHEWPAIAGADAATFTPLERGYATDKARVYHGASDIHARLRVVDGADAATFMVTHYDRNTRSEAKDKHRVYMNGQPLAPR